MGEILLACGLIMVVSLVGVISLWGRAGKVIAQNIDFLTSFSAGVFLIVAYGLFKETIEHAGHVSTALVWIIGGTLVIWTIFKLLPTLHQHSHGHEHQGHAIDPRRLLISDGLHNIGDGIVLAASFTASTSLGIAAAVSILFHELLQEISEFFLLREGGYSSRRALSLNFLASSTILIGAVGGYFLLDLFELIEVPLLGISAGAFLVVVLGDLIPHSLKATQERSHAFKHLFWFVLGGTLMFLMSTIAVH